MKSQKTKYILTEWTRDDEKLMGAVERNQQDKVHNLVVKKKLDPTKIEPNKGLSSLHLAVNKGHANILDVFLAQGLGTKIDTKDLEGYTATQLAAKSGQFPILQKLLQQKPNLCVFDRQMKSALHHACEGGNLGCVQLLLAENISVHFKDRDGKTVLCYAAEKGQASVCRLLIENGSEVNEADLEGRTPLLWAAMKNHSTVCSYLLQKGADVNATDSRGHTAMWYAVRNNDNELIKILHQAETANDVEGHASRKCFDKESLDHPYEPIGTELGRVEDDPLHEASSSEHTKAVVPVTPPPRPQRLPPFSGKSTSLLELDGSAEKTLGEKLGFKSDMLATKMDSDVLDASSRKKAASLGTKVASHVQTIDDDDDDDKKEDIGNLDIGEMNFGSFREMLDDAFRKNNLLNENDFNETGVMDDVKSVSLSTEEVETQDQTDQRIVPLLTVDEDEIYLPCISESILKEISPSKLSRKGSYAAMTPTSEASTSITAIAELNEKDAQHISLPCFDFSEVKRSSYVHEPQSSLDDVQYVSRDSVLKHSEDKVHDTSDQNINENVLKPSEDEVHDTSDQNINENILKHSEDEVHDTSDQNIHENVEDSKTIYMDILGNNSEDKLLGEHVKLLEELKMALEKRNEMELERIELMERLKLTSRSQKWIMQELAEMKNTIEDMIFSLDERNSSTVDAEKLRKDLEKIDSQLNCLMKMELEQIEDVRIYSHTPNSDVENRENVSTLNRLEKEKQDLASKLKEILMENNQLHDQVVDIEKLMSKAKEMKEENEALISDCKEFVETSGKDSAEVEDLMRLFKETIEENDILKIENEELLSKLNNMTVFTGVGDVDELKRENVRLMFERMQLEEAVERHSNALMEMTERLKIDEETLKHPKVEELNVQTSENVVSQECVQDIDYKQMYEELKSESMEVLDELRSKEALVMEYNKVVEEYEELMKQNELLKSTLDRKSADVKRLNEQVQDLGEQLEDAFREFKSAINAMQIENADEYNKLSKENNELRFLVEELNEALEEKDLVIAKKDERNESSDMKEMYQQDEFCQTENDNRKPRTPVYEDLRNAMLESKSLLDENNKLKKIVVELEEDKSRTSVDRDSELKDENQKLKVLNEKLQFEIASLKRTISEQGAYLAYLTPNSNDILPSEEVKVNTDKNVSSSNETITLTKQEAPNNKETKNHRAEIEKLTSEIIILRSQVECLEKMKEEVTKQNEEASNAQNTKLQSLEKLCSDLSKKTAEKEEKVLELNETLKEQQKDLMAAKRLESECDMLIKDYQNLSDLKSTLDNCSYSDKKVALVEVREWLNNMQKISNEQDKLQLDNEKLLDESKQMKAEVEELRSTNENLSSQRDVHDKDNEAKLLNMQQRLAKESLEVSKLKSALDELNKEEISLREQLDELKDQLIVKDAELRSGESKISDQMEAIQKENLDLKSILQSHVNHFSKEHEEALLNQIEILTNQASKLQSQLKDKTEEIDLLTNEMSLQIENLKSNLESCKNKSEEERKVVDDECRLLKANVDRLSTEKENVEREHKTVASELKLQLEQSNQSANELDKTKGDFNELHQNYARVHKDLEKLELDLKSITTENKKAAEKIVDLEKYCKELEVLNKHLNEKSSMAHSEDKITLELREANFDLKEKMDLLEQEKQKLLLEKEQTQLLLEMEKLKNLSVPEERQSPLRSFQNGLSPSSKFSRQSSPISNRHSLISVSPISKHLVDFDGFGFSNHNGEENRDLKIRLIEENKILRSTLDNIEYGFCQPMRLKSEATQTQADSKTKMIEEQDYYVSAPLALVAENRRLFLEVGNLHSSLRRRSSFIVHSNDWSSRHSSKPLEEQRQDMERAERSFLDEISSKSLEHLSVLIGLEDEVDHIWKNKISKHNGLMNGSASYQESSLINRLRLHNSSLIELKDLLQTVVDNEKFYDVALEELTSHYPLPAGINNIFDSFTTSSSIQRISSSEESSKLLTQLQQQLLENERKYKEIIQKYRRHLICAVQGQMDPEVKESLLSFIETKKHESRQ